MSSEASETIDIALNSLLEQVKQLIHVLERQEQCLVTRDSEALQKTSEQSFALSQKISKLTATLEQEELFQTTKATGHQGWGQVFRLAAQCQVQYSRNMEHLEDMSQYCSDFSKMLFSAKNTRYLSKNASEKKAIKASCLLVRA
ncbi:hypothetical protein [Parendozoicomonas sp. Alg238-R29]|uniref:hypothetical protein n=1 Tax=Parendozoicomonas sp. Alg238-R29 TaxID=2993446 RepID=UPI00248E3ECF|nr:hypothetical protein [Parendozoicomonas sp. Alg238-R29]